MRDSVTFIHAADLHLGAPFQGLVTDNETVGRELAEATYKAWERIVDTAIERSVDFVVLAGDLYDAADPSLHSQHSLRNQAQRLNASGIPLLIVRGNHDPLGGWSANLAMPPNVHVFPSGAVQRVETIAEDDFVCAVYGRSYQRAAETSDFTPGYSRDPRDTIAVGLLHSNVGNNPDYAPYAPAAVSSLCACGMDYWALGHIHKHQTLSEQPRVVYAGSPQGLNPKETGAHGCCLVTIERGGAPSLEHVEIAPVLWDSADIDITGLTTVDEVEARLNDDLDRMRAEASRPVAARINLVGRAEVHSDLTRPGVLAELVAEVRAEQSALAPWVWLDRLSDLSSAVLDVETLGRQPDFAGELVRIANELEDDDSALEALLGEVHAAVLEKLPDHQFSFGTRQLLEAARDRALDLLLADEGECR